MVHLLLASDLADCRMGFPSAAQLEGSKDKPWHVQHCSTEESGVADPAGHLGACQLFHISLRSGICVIHYETLAQGKSAQKQEWTRGLFWEVHVIRMTFLSLGHNSSVQKESKKKKTLTRHCVVDTGPVLTAVSLQPYPDRPVGGGNKTFYPSLHPRWGKFLMYTIPQPLRTVSNKLWEMNSSLSDVSIFVEMGKKNVTEEGVSLLSVDGEGVQELPLPVP